MRTHRIPCCVLTQFPRSASETHIKIHFLPHFHLLKGKTTFAAVSIGSHLTFVENINWKSNPNISLLLEENHLLLRFLHREQVCRRTKKLFLTVIQTYKIMIFFLFNVYRPIELLLHGYFFIWRFTFPQ